MVDRTKQKDPRVIRTRQLLRNAFIELLGEVDADKITVHQLAKRAMINRVTFYPHYRDIPDMVDKLAQEMTEDISKIIKEGISSKVSFEEKENMALVRLLEYIAEDAQFYKVVLGSRRIPVFTERLLQLLTELITERVESLESDSYFSTREIRKDIATWYASSAIIGVIVAWLIKDMPYTPHFLAKQFSLLAHR